MRIWLFIKLRDLSLWIYGYEHFGGGFSEDTMTIYARKRKPKWVNKVEPWVWFKRV